MWRNVDFMVTIFPMKNAGTNAYEIWMYCHQIEQLLHVQIHENLFKAIIIQINNIQGTALIVTICSCRSIWCLHWIRFKFRITFHFFCIRRRFGAILNAECDANADSNTTGKALRKSIYIYITINIQYSMNYCQSSNIFAIIFHLHPFATSESTSLWTSNTNGTVWLGIVF